MPRRFQVDSNFYQISFKDQEDNELRKIRLFHVSFFDIQSQSQLREKQDSELKRHIFDEIRHDRPLFKSVLAAFDLVALEHGGDSAAGLSRDRSGRSGRRRRGRADATNSIEVKRGEDPFEIDGAYVLRTGSKLSVQSRGSSKEEPAARLVLKSDATLTCEDGVEVENDGILELPPISISISLGGSRQYRVQLESTTCFLIEQLNGQPSITSEERTIAIQCLSWIFNRSYRTMKYRTLGGRGWYPTAEQDRLAFPQRQSFHRNRREEGPRVFLYRGFGPTVISVQAGPCLKVDLSIRLLQAQNGLERFQLLKKSIENKVWRESHRAATNEEVNTFLQQHMAGRSCVTIYNHITYKIQLVDFAKNPDDSFECDGTRKTFYDYFWERWNITLERSQPMLHCPTRQKADLYLPLQAVSFTGLEEEWKSDKGFMSNLWKELSKPPGEHWEHQGKLIRELTNGDGLPPLDEWGLTLQTVPVKVNASQLPSRPVYFAAQAQLALMEGQEPEELQANTSERGFQPPPGMAFSTQVWTNPDEELEFAGICIFYEEDARQRNAEPIQRFKEFLQSKIQETIDAKGWRTNYDWWPEMVRIQARDATAWVNQLQAERVNRRSKFAVVVVPDWVKKDNPQVYFKLKQTLTFQNAGIASQIVLNSTLTKVEDARPDQQQRQQQIQQQIAKNICQQIFIKFGAWFWTFSPLRFGPQLVMVVGVDARSSSRDNESVIVLSASTNQFFTRYFTTWEAKQSTRRGVDYQAPCSTLLVKALIHFMDTHQGRPPDTVLLYRSGVSDSQEVSLFESEVKPLTENGGLAQLLRDEIEAREDMQVNLDQWQQEFQMAFILVRRNTGARFRTHDSRNVPSGTMVDSSVVEDRAPNSGKYDFFLVSQSCPAHCTARPALYSVLHSNLTRIDRPSLVDFTYMLCGLYQTYGGRVAIPAPLRYAVKATSQLCKMDSFPNQPTPQVSTVQRRLFMV